MVSLFREAHHCCVLTPTRRIPMIHLNSGARKSFGMTSGKKGRSEERKKACFKNMEFFPCTTDPSGEIQAVFVYIEKNAHLNAFESVSVRAARNRLTPQGKFQRRHRVDSAFQHRSSKSKQYLLRS